MGEEDKDVSYLIIYRLTFCYLNYRKIRIPCQEINSLMVQFLIEAVPIFCAA